MRYIKQSYYYINRHNNCSVFSIKLLLLLLFFSRCISIEAQEFKFSEVRDKDGYVNVRDSKEIAGNNIIDKLSNGFIVTHFGEVDNNWILVDYIKNENILSGYVYRNRIKDIDDFKKVPKLLENDRFVQFSDGIIDVKIRIKNFERKKHSFEYFKNESNQLYKIDGEQIYGTDGNIPNKEYQSINVEINSEKISIPRSAFKNLFEPNLSSTKVNYDVSTKTLYIQSLNSDGAGGYAVLWVIKENKYNERVISIPF